MARLNYPGKGLDRVMLAIVQTAVEDAKDSDGTTALRAIAWLDDPQTLEAFDLLHVPVNESEFKKLLTQQRAAANIRIVTKRVNEFWKKYQSAPA